MNLTSRNIAFFCGYPTSDAFNLDRRRYEWDHFLPSKQMRYADNGRGWFKICRARNNLLSQRNPCRYPGLIGEEQITLPRRKNATN